MDEAEETQEQTIDPIRFAAEALEAVNLAESIDDNELASIGGDVCREYQLDYDSMSDWRDRMQRGIDLAKMVKTEKTYPFNKASNVKYPLITSAALQFNARAYPAIVPAEMIVKCKTYGSDPQGTKAARAERVSQHMSWQLACQVDEWEEETDKLLVQLPIVGTMVRKIWYDQSQQRIRCRVVDAGAFVVNDKVKVLGDAPRVSEEMSLYPDEITERINAGLFLDVDLENAEDEDKSKPEVFIEQHTRLDLDGDEYREPYIVTVHKESRKVVRIVADYKETDIKFEMGQTMVPQVAIDPQTGMEVTRLVPQQVPVGITAIRRGSYFVPYHFLPSLDGGFHGTGLGLLLGDISDSINTIINMMMDAGHMASLGGGFIGSDFRLKGGANRFSPGEWKQVTAKGGTIRDSVVPMTFPSPDATLFSLLGMLIEAGRELSSVKDVMTGDSGGQQMTATATIALIEQGMMVFTASYKRIFRALKREFGLIAEINAETVSAEEYNAFHDEEEQYDPAQEYSTRDMDISPVADPRSVTKMQEASKAQLILQLAEQGMVDMGEASERVMQAMDIADRDALKVQPNPMEEQMMAMQAKDAEAALTLRMVSIQQALADIEETRSKTMKNLSDAAADREGVRLDRMKMQLEALRDGIVVSLGQGAGRMAQQPRFPTNAGMPAQAVQGREGIGISGLLGGDAV